MPRGFLMDSWTQKVTGRLGFGFARFPLIEGDVDYQAVNQMVDAFMAAGHNYFDTAVFYAGGHSEEAIRRCVVERYSRESFVLSDKLTSFMFGGEDEIEPMFQRQLDACGVDYFDFYLIHGLSKEYFRRYEDVHAFQKVQQFMEQGRVRHLGVSFHDRAEELIPILEAYPQIEMVQIQFNYLDYEDARVESRRVYEICQERGIPTVVMEPLRNGCLVDMPQPIQQLVDQMPCIGAGTNASIALRFALDFPNNAVVLSGMTTLDQVRENCETELLTRTQPMTAQERQILAGVHEAFNSLGTVPCTNCEYCLVDCPQHIHIPGFVDCVNKHRIHQVVENAEWYYLVNCQKGGSPRSCVQCGACESKCPQHLPLVKILQECTKLFSNMPL